MSNVLNMSALVEDDNKTKKCPYCAEQILSDAVKCRFCGEFLVDSLRPSQSSAPESKQNVAPEPKQTVIVKEKGEGLFLQTLNCGCVVVIIVIALVCIFIYNFIN